MTDKQRRVVAAAALTIGAVLGMAGAFAPTDELRALAWGIDGVGVVVGSAMLVMHHLRRGNEMLAAGFLVFLAGETVIVSASGVELSASGPSLAAGAALWSAGLGLVSVSSVMPRLVRVMGVIAAVLLGVTAVRIFGGAALTPLSKPLPFFAFPFLAFTLVGWAWAHARPAFMKPIARPHAVELHANAA